eukprot:10844383-Ditylum_brightwellii.AAC.1
MRRLPKLLFAMRKRKRIWQTTLKYFLSCLEAMLGTVTASSRLSTPQRKYQTPSETATMGKTRGKDKGKGQEKILMT